MKLILAVPTYGPVDPQASRHLRVAIMHAAQNGVEWVGDLSPDKMKWEVARNTVVTGAIDSPAEGVLWVDSDVILPDHAITSLVKARQDFICGIYHQRIEPYWPLIALFDKDRQTFNWVIEWPKHSVMPIDGCGFGIVLTSTAMLRKMTPPWFTFEKFSEDFDFCLRAAAAGYQPHVHTDVQCGHLKESEQSTLADFERIKASGELRRFTQRPADSAA